MTTPPPTPVVTANEEVFVWFAMGLPLTVEEFDDSAQLSFRKGCSQPWPTLIQGTLFFFHFLAMKITTRMRLNSNIKAFV
jgi:hypothetical protein